MPQRSPEAFVPATDTQRPLLEGSRVRSRGGPGGNRTHDLRIRSPLQPDSLTCGLLQMCPESLRDWCLSNCLAMRRVALADGHETYMHKPLVPTEVVQCLGYVPVIVAEAVTTVTTAIISESQGTNDKRRHLATGNWLFGAEQEGGASSRDGRSPQPRYVVGEHGIEHVVEQRIKRHVEASQWWVSCLQRNRCCEVGAAYSPSAENTATSDLSPSTTLAGVTSPDANRGSTRSQVLFWAAVVVAARRTT